jgi:hypothetical protein
VISKEAQPDEHANHYMSMPGAACPRHIDKIAPVLPVAREERQMSAASRHP